MNRKFRNTATMVGLVVALGATGCSNTQVPNNNVGVETEDNEKTRTFTDFIDEEGNLHMYKTVSATAKQTVVPDMKTEDEDDYRIITEYTVPNGYILTRYNNRLIGYKEEVIQSPKHSNNNEMKLIR